MWRLLDGLLHCNSDDDYNTNTNLVILAGHRKHLHHNHSNISKAIEVDDNSIVTIGIVGSKDDK